MLAIPGPRDGVDEFVSQWLRFDRVLTAARERRCLPSVQPRLARVDDRGSRGALSAIWSGTIGTSWKRSRRTTASSIPIWQRFTRCRRRRAISTGLNFPPESERAGFLGQALFLTLTSKPDDTAPTGRGLFVREQFLCQQVPPPPPGVDTNLPPVDEAKPVTNRERLAMHATNQMCAGCHSLIDPIGFGFEKFDAIGMRREKHKLLFYPNRDGCRGPAGQAERSGAGSRYRGLCRRAREFRVHQPRQLGELLARTPQCQECIVKQVFRYMAGRLDTPADRPCSARRWRLSKSGFRFKELMVSLVKCERISRLTEDCQCRK